MADLWSQREFALMHGGVNKHNEVTDQLLHDDKTYDVEGKGYSWTQTQEEIEIHFHGHPLTAEEAKKHARVNIRSRHLEVILKGLAVYDDDLWEVIRAEESSWFVVDGILVVQLSKVPLDPPERNNWPRCGKAEPHKYEKAYKAKMANAEAKRGAAAEARNREQNAKHEQKNKTHASVVELDALSSPQDFVTRLDANSNVCNRFPESHDMPKSEDHTSAVETSALIEEDSDDDEQPPLAPTKSKRGATTGTYAELQRQKHEQSMLESQRWKRGTASEAWGKKENRPKGLGPVPLSEAVRRGEISNESVNVGM